MFVKSARYYDAMYSHKDYQSASRQVHELIQERRPGARTLLDVGCGSGKHLEFLCGHYSAEGLDINPGLLAVAGARSPQAKVHQADMVDFDLGRTFDVVTCLFSSIGYVKTLERMRRAIGSMARHLRPGGLMLIEPWFTPENYWTGTITSNHVDLPDLRIAWMYTSERRNNVSVLDIHYLVGTPQGIECFTELHEMGLFTHEEYIDAMRTVGLVVDHLADGFFGRGMYVGTLAA